MQKFVLVAIATLTLALLGWGMKAGVELELQRQHLSRVCEPGTTQAGRKAGLFYGAWTHRVEGLGKSASKAEKIEVCKVHGFNPED